LLEPIKSSLFVKETSSALIPRNQSSYSSTSERKEVRIPTATNTTKPLRHNVRPFQDSSKFLPTTSLASRQHCEPGPHQPLSRVSAFTNYANSSDYWTDLKYYPANLPVVCEFNNLLTSATHFPHAMQQFYGCFSYWQEYPNNRPVLLLSHKIQKKLQRNPFLKGTLQVFQSQLQVEVTDKESFTQQNNNSAINPQSITISGGYILKHAKKLNQLVRKELNLPDDSSKSCNQDKPRISILNRRKSVGRSIINAEILSEMPSMKNLSRNDEVLVEYFEGLDFSEQVSFFQSTDILIAPHGAQLTGAAFLDAPCSHLVELFPKVSLSLTGGTVKKTAPGGLICLKYAGLRHSQFLWILGHQFGHILLLSLHVRSFCCKRTSRHLVGSGTGSISQPLSFTGHDC
jgi:hypothetical protein